MTDIRGKEINVKDVVAYPCRQYSSMWLNVGTVIEIRKEGIVVSVYEPTRRVHSNRYVRNIKNMVVVESTQAKP